MHEEIYYHRKKFTVAGWNISVLEPILKNWDAYLLKKCISCQRKTFSVGGRNLLSQEEIYYHRKKSNFKGINFLSRICVWRYFLWQEEISCHRKKFIVTGRNFLSRSTEFLVKLQMRQQMGEFPKTFRVSPLYFVGDYIPLSLEIYNPGTN